MQLIYRGETFQYTPAQPQPYHQPRALNWRYQAPGELYGEAPPITRAYQHPRALNWRY